MSKSKTVSTFVMPKCTMEVRPEQDVINDMIVATEAGTMVDGLNDNWFGQFIAHSRLAVVKAGKAVTTYEEAASLVGKVIEGFKKSVMSELDQRRVDITTGTLTADEKTEALSKHSKTRASLDNCIRSAKTVITGALKKGDTILKIVDDGGHVLFRKDGTSRGKSQLQTLIKRAKLQDAPDASPLERATQAAATLARRLVDLDQTERKQVLDQMYTKLREMDSERDDLDVVADDDGETLAEAA